MKKAHRVKSQHDFQRVYHKGSSKANRQLVLYYLEKPDQDHFRLGLSVGKKLGNAVQRNQIKRYIRQAVTELSPAIAKTFDFLLIARPDINTKNYHEIKQSVIHVMKLASKIDVDKLSDQGGMHERKK